MVSFIPWKNATSHVITQGLHYASAVFEGERAYSGKIFKSKNIQKDYLNQLKLLVLKFLILKMKLQKAKDDLIKKMNTRPIVILGQLFGEEVNKWDSLQIIQI